MAEAKKILDMGRALGRALGLPVRVEMDYATDRVMIGIDPASGASAIDDHLRQRLKRDADDAMRLMIERAADPAALLGDQAFLGGTMNAPQQPADALTLAKITEAVELARSARQSLDAGLLQQRAFDALHGAGLGAVAQQYRPPPTIFDLDPGPHPGAGDFAEPDLSKALHTLLAAGRMVRPDKPVWVHPVWVSGLPYYVLGRSIEDYELGGRLSYDMDKRMLRQDNLPAPERRRSRLTREAGFPRHVDHDEIINVTWGLSIADWPQMEP